MAKDKLSTSNKPTKPGGAKSKGGSATGLKNPAKFPKKGAKQ
jgi:hypothetical protein